MEVVREIYTARRTERERSVAALRITERRISAFRLAAIALVVILMVFREVLGAAVPVIAFAALVIAHERVIRRRVAAEAGAAFYRRGIERLDDDWAGRGVSGDRYRDEHHLYAADLDLFGKASLFELTCMATTRAGQDALAEWLLRPATTAEEIRSRQESVRELRERVDLREEMFVVGGEVAGDLESRALADWAGAAPVEVRRWERIAALLLPAISVIVLAFTAPPLIGRFIAITNPEAGFQSRLVPVWPLIVTLAAQMVLARRLAARAGEITRRVERTEAALAQLGRLIAVAERQQFKSARLGALHSAFAGTSRSIERLRRLVALLDSARNQFFAPFAALLLWTTNTGLAIERWRVAHGGRIVAALRAVAELEALLSVAGFAFENPSYAFPSIEGAAVFDAEALGHPLIPASRRVCNDVRLGDDLRLLVISGSNMSGKSTLLRSTGVAAVLALAGAPVCARSLRIAPLAIGASIRINDSLAEGSSRFYAEILRIRDVIARTGGSQPLLFLLDEVLHGTNSHDRRIGAEGIVRRLLDGGAIGLVSTHDLALADVAERLAPRAANVHFEDRLEAGRVVFDYRMRPGIVTHSNALALMRAVGIEV